MASRDIPESDDRAGVPLSNPHDALFKFLFSQPENAAAELRTVLPKELSSRLDWASLALSPASFVDERLKGREADLLFSVRCQGRDAFLYLLLEHQSTSDVLMPFRLLRYVVRIWDAFLQGHPDARKLPAVIPVVIHHSDAGWSTPTELLALIDLDEHALEAVSPFVPRFRFLLDDLAVGADDTLRVRSEAAVATAGLLLLARGRTSPDLLSDLWRWLDLFRSVVVAPNGLSALVALMTYALDVGDIRPDDLYQFVRQLGPEATEAHMTGAQRLREEGKADLLLRQLEFRFGPLPVAASGRVRNANPGEVELWAERVLTAPDLDGVFR
ncbi:MAG TPA: Rpn family recombination-promoting nuclease/putative transposase [Polyangiaceae bacterium]